MRRVLASILFVLLAVGSFAPHVHAAPSQHAGSHPSLQRGATGSFVMELQRRLNAWGGSARLPVTGTFGPGTEGTVKAFQAAKGLPVLGVVGPKTWAALPPDPTPGASAPAPAGGAPTSPGNVVISAIFYDGAEYRSEGDEYAVITNRGGAAVSLRGWLLYADDPGQNFYFPSFTLKAGAAVRVYTNRNIAGSFSFNRGSAVWNNEGDCGYLYNAAGAQVSRYCY